MLLATIRNYQPELDVILWHPAKMRLIDDGYKKTKEISLQLCAAQKCILYNVTKAV